VKSLVFLRSGPMYYFFSLSCKFVWTRFSSVVCWYCRFGFGCLLAVPVLSTYLSSIRHGIIFQTFSLSSLLHCLDFCWVLATPDRWRLFAFPGHLSFFIVIRSRFISLQCDLYGVAICLCFFPFHSLYFILLPLCSFSLCFFLTGSSVFLYYSGLTSILRSRSSLDRPVGRVHRKYFFGDGR